MKTVYIYGNISTNSFLKWEMFQTNLYKKLQHILYIQKFSPESRAIYETMCKNIVEPVRP